MLFSSDMHCFLTFILNSFLMNILKIFFIYIRELLTAGVGEWCILEKSICMFIIHAKLFMFYNTIYSSGSHDKKIFKKGICEQL